MGREFVVRRVVDAEQGQAVRLGNGDRAEPRGCARNRDAGRSTGCRPSPTASNAPMSSRNATGYDLTPADLLRNLDARAELDNQPANH